MPLQRFPMRLDPLWRPGLLIGGATPGKSYVELDDETLHMRFGWFFRQSIPRNEIESADQTSWSMLHAIGWGVFRPKRYGFIGSTNGVVELHLSKPIRIWGYICPSIAVSLEDPERFLAALAVPASA